MAIVRASAVLEEGLNRSADSWSLLDDAKYRALVARWRREFLSHLERSTAIQDAEALDHFEALLPASVFLFNGVSVPHTGVVTSARHPCAYSAVGLRSLSRELVNNLDLVLVDEAFTACCICTHEWKALANPIFVKR